jgi:glyoxylase-like metal-dependent hydrolase (beta-lactamase superfamily II)
MTLKVHHLNCGTMCPSSQRLLTGAGSFFRPAEQYCHCLLIEGNQGLILVDTGFGTYDVQHPEELDWLVRRAIRPRFAIEETALHQVQGLGFRASDVRHIVATHLHLDHAGGLPDFPSAEVHVHALEQRAALAPPSRGERVRYSRRQFAHGVNWRPHDQTRGQRWFGFESIEALPGTADRVLLIPLHGHTRGHVGVAVATPAGWLLHAGDAYYFRGEIDPVTPRCPPALALSHRLGEIDRVQRLQNRERLRALARDHGHEVAVFCAHDPADFAQRAPFRT